MDVKEQTASELYGSEELHEAYQTFLTCSNEKQEITQYLIDTLDENDYVLDIGSGTGIITVPVAEHVEHVTTVDPNTSVLKELGQRRRNHNLENIETLNARWEDADIEREYDAAICSHVAHLLEPQPSFQKLQSHTSSTYLITNNPLTRTPQSIDSNQPTVNEFIAEFEETLPDNGYYRDTAETYKQPAREAGVEISSDEIPVEIEARSFSSFHDVAVLLLEQPSSRMRGMEEELRTFYEEKSQEGGIRLQHANIVTTFNF